MIAAQKRSFQVCQQKEHKVLNPFDTKVEPVSSTAVVLVRTDAAFGDSEAQFSCRMPDPTTTKLCIVSNIFQTRHSLMFVTVRTHSRETPKTSSNAVAQRAKILKSSSGICFCTMITGTF